MTFCLIVFLQGGSKVLVFFFYYFIVTLENLWKLRNLFLWTTCNSKNINCIKRNKQGSLQKKLAYSNSGMAHVAACAHGDASNKLNSNSGSLCTLPYLGANKCSVIFVFLIFLLLCLIIVASFLHLFPSRNECLIKQVVNDTGATLPYRTSDLFVFLEEFKKIFLFKTLRPKYSFQFDGQTEV